MFIQVISGKVIDANLLNQQHERWLAELKPGASGYLGFTGGITADNRSISIARFESEAAAQANSERDEQGQWWDNTAGAYEGTPTFSNCTDADLLFGGGSNDAGFVQVIQGRAKDREATRKFMQEGQDQLREDGGKAAHQCIAPWSICSAPCEAPLPSVRCESPAGATRSSRCSRRPTSARIGRRKLSG